MMENYLAHLAKKDYQSEQLSLCFISWTEQAGFSRKDTSKQKLTSK